MKNYPYLPLLVLVLAAPTRADDKKEMPEKLPPGAKVVKLEVYPPAIAIKGPFDYRQIIVSATLQSGETVDVTRLAQAEKAGFVSLSPTGIVRPLADGNGVLKFTMNGQTAAVPVVASGTKDKPAVSFVRDVMPVLGKMGCNAGTCHGAQSGKNGFKLSLRGYDPLFDHRALTDDLSGRRFDRSAPDKSLMLLKLSGAVPHVGGTLSKPGEPYYEVIRAWIADGVKLDLNVPRVTRIEIVPKAAVLPLPEMKQQMAVLATYNDGTVRDVSSEAFVESSNTEVATVDKRGLVTSVRRGEAAMLARYEGSYAAATLVVMGNRAGFAWKQPPVNSWIDTLVYDKLKVMRIQPSELCSDGDFIRRLYLDLTGLPPQPDEVRAFLTDQRPTQVKRDELVDKLIGSPDFIELWTNKWADLLQVNRKFLGEPGAKAFREWVRKAIAENMPYDQFAYQILTASGSNVANPPASYFKIHRKPDDVMENTTHLFLAIRFNCNKCHDHPFERWTQDQYYHLAAYFARVGHREDEKYRGQRIGGTAVEGALPLVEVISDQSSGEVKHDRTGATTPPAFPYTHAGSVPENASRREQLARWITAKENPYFAKSYVNRIWSYLLGVGIIEPVDDIRAGNPASNPALLDRLTNEFIAGGFDVRKLMAAICKSRTYQHSLQTNQWNQDDDINYSHAIARRLPAEVLYDTIHRAIGSEGRLPGLPAGTRAAQLLDSSVPIPGAFLELFGKPARESACECERSSGMMLGPVLNLVNGPVLGDALKDPNNRLAKLAKNEKDDQKLVREVFLSILCREPNAMELQKGLQALKGAQADYDRLAADYTQRARIVAEYEKTLPAKQAQWEKNLQNATVWTVLEPTKLQALPARTKLVKQKDNSILATANNQGPLTYTITASTPLTGITGVRLEVLTDPTLPGKGPGRAPNGNFVLNEFKMTAAPLGDPGKGRLVTFQRAQADFSQASFDVQNAIDGNAATGWAVHPEVSKPHVAVFEAREPINFPGGALLTFTLDQQYVDKQHNLGKFRLSVTTAKPPITLAGPPPAIAKILSAEPEKRTDDQKTALANYFRSLDGELARLQRDLAEHALPSDRRLLGIQDLAWALINSPAFLFNH